jgi:hypothetical protein
MVIGGFTAAIDDASLDTSSRPAVAGELDVETREMGDAPISALSDQAPAQMADDAGGEFSGPMAMYIGDDEVTERPDRESEGFARDPTGTRAVGVTAYGPYGTMSAPYLEGETVLFESDMTGGASNSDYFFAWDVDSDGVYEKDFGTVKGETDYAHEFRDNLIGDATVDAWDGVSYTTSTASGTVWDNKAFTPWYWNWIYYWTVGYRFELNADVDITELGFYRHYVPYWVYNIRIWTDSGTLIYSRNSPSPQSTYSWNWYSIPTISLTAGTYRISAYFRGYSFPSDQDGRDPTPDGIIQPTHMCYTSGNGYPSALISSDSIPYLDMAYEYSTTVPLVYSDSTGVFVDNNAPIATGLSVTPSEGVEGSDVEFMASLFDTGLDDTWEYRWIFGDGEVSDWRSVNKWDGGGRVLMATTWSASQAFVRQKLVDLLGDWLVNIEMYNWYAEGSPPDLEYMQQFDVVLVGTNYIPSATLAADMGDRCAEYVDSGGNLVQMWSSFHTSDRLTGRWTDEDYIPIERGSLNFGMQNMGTVYDPSHPIMNGVTAVNAYYKHNSYAVTPYATRLADYTTGRVLAAYNDMNHPNAPTSRIVGLSMFPNSDSYVGGDAWTMICNALKWASQQPDPTPKPMPIPLDPVSHTYVDDHPTPITPFDVFDVTVEIRDDDHEAAMVIGSPTTLMTENFATGVPPAGWTRDSTNWRTYYGTLAGGSSPECRFYWIPYGTTTTRMYTTVDTTGYGAYQISFKEYLNHFGGPYTLAVQTSLDGVTWDTVFEHVNPTGFGAHTEYVPASALNAGGTMYLAWTFIGDPYNLNWWHIDDIVLEGIQAYVMDGLGTASTTVTIHNVYPTAVIPEDFVDIVDEKVILNFENLMITDPAFTQLSEDFYWRVNFDDGSPLTPWTQVTSVIEGLNVLFYHSLGAEGIGPLRTALEPVILAIEPGATFAAHDFLNDGDMTLEEMLEYDVVVIGINWAGFDPNSVGDLVADYADAGGSVVETVASFHSTPGWWGLGGRWQSEGYSCLQPGGIGFTSYSSAIYDPAHPIINGPAGTVNRFGTGIPISSPGETAGSTLLVDYPAFPAAAYNDETNPNPGLGRTVGLNVFYYPGYYYNDALTLLANSIMWAQAFRPRSSTLPTFQHDYGDNGIYYVDLQFIDDDMYWDLSGGYPVYVGPVGEEEYWISHNVVPIEVYNVDPTIGRVSAYAEFEMSLRMSGNKDNTAVMRLYENDVVIAETAVLRDPGSPDIGVMGATINMGKGYDYDLIVEYIPEDDDGANPTWIFEGHWPDGKIKQLKHTFNSNDPTDTIWNLGSVKNMMLGHDIIFMAGAYDPGSDDLAFIYNFGDSTPFGVHLYENVNPSATVEGTSDEATVLFNQIAGDPWFDVAPNTIRSPAMNPIYVTDTISHVFDEGQPYYYYVHLTVMDDDVCDDYPSFSINPGSDSEYFEIDFR